MNKLRLAMVLSLAVFTAWIVWRHTSSQRQGVGTKITTPKGAKPKRVVVEKKKPVRAKLGRRIQRQKVLPDPVACPGPAEVKEYLWGLYEKTPKRDAFGVFTHKDVEAAKKAGRTLREEVIDGVDDHFSCRVYRLAKALEVVGYQPGITSAYRDEYRQSLIGNGMRARVGKSFHGGRRVGGWGHGLAIDIVSLEGSTYLERLGSSRELWSWVRANGKHYGTCMPYPVKDPPHLAPCDGTEMRIAKWRGLRKKKKSS